MFDVSTRVSVFEVMRWIEELAPSRLAESWDQVGLQCGREDASISRVLTVLTLSEDAVNEAVRLGTEMIVAHHPLIFKPLNAIAPDTRVGSLLYRVIESGIAFGVAHTNLDKASAGVNEGLARRVGLIETTPLVPEAESSPNVKLVTFLPEEAEGAVRGALAAAGAGVIGRYTHCAFSVLGEGAFRPLAGSVPHVGAPGELTRVNELRLESVVNRRDLDGVVAALNEAHPYEEVPIDLYPLESVSSTSVGLGRIGTLPNSMNSQEFVNHVKKTLALPWCRIAGKATGAVRRVAVVGGSGGGFVERARMAGADAILTGDVDYHDADEAAYLGILVVDAGHYGTEKHVPHDLAAYLRKRSQEAGRTLAVDVFDESDVFVLG